jgi:uncharacterized protein YaiL (DUF2058 family)
VQSKIFATIYLKTGLSRYLFNSDNQNMTKQHRHKKRIDSEKRFRQLEEENRQLRMEKDLLTQKVQKLESANQKLEAEIKRID